MKWDARKSGRLAAWACAALAVIGQAEASTLTRQPDWVLEGESASLQFGGAVNAQADLNKDGINDLIVSASGAAVQRGRIEVFLGSRKGPSKTPAFRYEGTMDYAQVGSSPIVADVNGDGWPDLLVGAYNQSGAVAYNGAVLVFLGSSAGLPATPSQVIEGPSTNSFFGWKIRSLGDFNGDGYADVLVSAIGAKSNVGTLYVYKGSASGLVGTPVSTLSGAAPWIYFGRIVETGDLNNDGIADILVGASSPVGGIPGMAWVYHGSAAGYTSTKAETLFSPITLADADAFGENVAVLGDVDADGYTDVAVAAPRHFQDTQNFGLIVVYYGSAQGLAASGRTQILQPNSDTMPFMGMNMLGGRDFNGDGVPDLVLGTAANARPSNPADPFPGAIWIYRGSSSGLDTTKVYKVNGKEGSRDELGLTVDLGNVTGTGAVDLITSSGVYSNTLSQQGVVRVFRGVRLSR